MQFNIILIKFLDWSTPDDREKNEYLNGLGFKYKIILKS